jgi:hypothetical protein
MFCYDIVHRISQFLSFKDIYYLRQTCQYFKTIPYPSLKKSFSETINSLLNLNKNDIFAKHLLEVINEHKELSIAGSLILEILNEESYDSTIEIYVHINYDCMKSCFDNDLKERKAQSESYKKLVLYLKQNEFSSYSGYELGGANQFWHNKTFKNKYGKEIRIVFIPILMEEKIRKTVDMTFCNNYYDGDILYLSNPNDIFNKSGKLNSYSSENLKYFADLKDFTSDFEKILYHLRTFHDFGYEISIDGNIFIFEKEDPNYVAKFRIFTDQVLVSINNSFTGSYTNYTFKEHSHKGNFVLETDRI